MRLTFVRHAESVSNRKGVLSGHGRSPLTAEGRRQAARLSRCRPELASGQVVASDLPRVRQTVALAVGTGVDVTIDARWRERDFGAFEGLPQDVAAARDPLAADSEQPAAFHVRAPGGESWADVFLRVREALRDLLAEPTHDVAVFAHGGTIRLAWCVLMGVDPATHMWRVGVENTSVARFEIGGPQPRMIAWNDVGHLDRIPADTDLSQGPGARSRETAQTVV